MDNLDIDILEALQNSWKICSRPYAEIGMQLGISEEEVISRVKNLYREGAIRRISAIFNPAKLGYKSTLCAMYVPPESIDEVCAILNNTYGITHNYLRDDDTYNLWFTLIRASDDEIQQTIKTLMINTNIEVHSFPSEKLYKIEAKFKLEVSNNA